MGRLGWMTRRIGIMRIRWAGSRVRTMGQRMLGIRNHGTGTATVGMIRSISVIRRVGFQPPLYLTVALPHLLGLHLEKPTHRALALLVMFLEGEDPSSHLDW